MATLAASLRVWEYWLMQYRRIWRGTAVTSIVNPVFYLGALGVGLGTLVNKSGGAPLGVPYLDFVAPGMLAAAAMQVAASEAMWPVMGSFNWTRQYFAMIATPLGVRNVVVGHQFFMLARLAATAAVYFCVIAAFGGIDSWWGLLAVPAAVLTGAAFTTPLAAYAATQDTHVPFVTVNRFVILPMFLFAGVFFPVSRLPLLLEWVAYVTPLWHGVDLCRQLTLGDFHAARLVAHLVYLLVLVVGGLFWAERTYARRLFT